jgi:signal transduction histidine kinase
MGNKSTQFIFFRRLILTVSFFCLTYGAVYLFLGAFVSGASLILANLLLSPLIYILTKEDHENVLARHIFVASGSIYIYVAPKGIHQDVNAEFYLLPNMLVTLLIFETYQKKEIVISLIFPLIAWFLIHGEIFPDLPASLMPQKFPTHVFQHMNFIGSFILVGIMIKFFIDYTENLKQSSIHDLLDKNAELMQAEQETRKSQRIAEQERAKSAQNARLATLGELSAGIAHEMNNPITIINGNVSACLAHEKDPNKIQERLKKIEKATERLNKIVGGLRKFSRSGGHSDKKSHQVSKLISEVLTLTETKSKTTQTLVEVDCRTQAEILCEEIEIGQVLINLINNAIDAVKENKEKWVRITAFDRGDQVILQVRDSGKGIPPEIAEKLFQAFFTTKPVGEGTGLGLSIIKGILEEHKATIELRQDDPHTCFEITFQKAD